MYIMNKVSTRGAAFLCFFAAFSAHGTSVTLPYSFTAGSPISASQMMGNFSSITSALSSTVSSPWVASSSNIYFNTGSVGIGSSAPAYALDVNGGVRVSGNVMQPSKPAFFASGGATTYTATAGTNIAFGYLTTTFASSSRNAGYNTSTSQYTAPVTGLYYFYYQLFVFASVSGIEPTWFKNGSILSYGYNDALSGFLPSTTGQIINGSVIIELNAGDYIAIQPRPSTATFTYYGAHSSFFGYLIG